ncbi:MAG: chemotaxis-specific protein-glutamate methyltransferase CheB [Gemmatimonadaceae bacterium]|nr:chemotaxis-specific protein-glutamate methyltransferase CheB [Gloeobacterales cyanobacterium ES-bin-141]
MRIAIANSTPGDTEVIRRVLERTPQHRVTWTARDGLEAVQRCALDTPDLVLMDLAIPLLGGVEATRRIMAASPCAVLIVTDALHGNPARLFEAIGAGALDVVQTPVPGIPTEEANLLKKIDTIARLTGFDRVSGNVSQRNNLLVTIGASAGGPKALAALLASLPRQFPAPIVVVQHIGAEFTPGLISWLNEQAPLLVKPAAEGDSLEAGTVYVAARAEHLFLARNQRLGYTQVPRNCPYCPSIDVFFNSVATHGAERSIGVLLTGMGQDGASGLLELRRAGAHTIAQDQASSAVYGMPKAAAWMGAAVDILPLNAIGSALVRFCTKKWNPIT